MAGIDRTRRIAFEEQADRYDSVALTYPASLVDDIVRLSGVTAGSRILEIGCGSGQATVSFAERDFAITAVELGERLAQLAAQKLRAFPNVQVIQHEFESWELPAQPFELVISAEAFHWIVPEIGIPKVARALIPGGMLALFWGVIARLETPLHQAIAAAYAEVAPDWVNPLASEVDANFIHRSIAAFFERVGGFEPLQARFYPACVTSALNCAQHLDELRAFSSHREMPDAARQALYAAITAAFQAHQDRLEQNIGYLLLYTHPCCKSAISQSS